jgi:hypothetical protein
MKPAAAGRRPGRSPAVAAKTPAKLTKTAATTKPAPLAAVSAKVSKDELRAQVEKLERANATLRTKSREANRTAKMNAVRIAELEDQVAQLEKQAASETASATRGQKPTEADHTKRQSRVIDPGDAVPPGVAVQEPAALDEEAKTALEHLETHLGAR